MDTWRLWQKDVQIPCLHRLPRGFMPGRKFRFRGTVLEDCEKFILNFQSEKDSEPFCHPVPFRLNFNFKDSVFSRNDWDPEFGWGEDETDERLPMWLRDNFELLVTCTDNFFLVDVDGERYCEFLHRQEPWTIGYLTIFGDVVLDTIEYNQ